MNTTFERDPHHGKDEWLTPPEIINMLGPFDLDPCSPINRPWPTAQQHYTIEDNGLLLPWHGRVWCNPPYGGETGHWLQKCFDHGNALALIYARTQTVAFHKWVWKRADAVLFIKGKISFYHVTGKKAKNDAGAGSVIVAYGADNVTKLFQCSIIGHRQLLEGKRHRSEAVNQRMF